MPKPIAKTEIDRDTRDAAAALYFGEVMHARLKPMGHRFSYRVMSLLIDLDRLDAADRQCSLFGVNRAALYSFNEADHGERNGSPLRAYAQRRADEHGIDLTGGRVLLLCYPRLLGYTFNPLSVYFCYRADGALVLMIYEVRNTFRRHPCLRTSAQAGPNQRCRRPAATRQAVLPLSLHRYGDALLFPRFATGRKRQVANSGDRPRGPPAVSDFQRPPPCLDHAGAAAVGFLAAAGDLEDFCGDPLGSVAALAQGSASGASPGCRTCEGCL
jgi:hypothetical protein